METERVVMNRLNIFLTSRTSTELIELLDIKKFNEFVEKYVGIMPFYYNVNSLYYTFCKNHITSDSHKAKL
jgi:hypothetical protein